MHKNQLNLLIIHIFIEKIAFSNNNREQEIILKNFDPHLKKV